MTDEQVKALAALIDARIAYIRARMELRRLIDDARATGLSASAIGESAGLASSTVRMRNMRQRKAAVA